MNPVVLHPWMDEAACTNTDPNLHFDETRWSARSAKEICATCPVIEQCAMFAVRTRPEAGIWAGMTIPELRRLRKKLAQRAWRAKAKESV